MLGLSMLLSQECDCYPGWHDLGTLKKLGQVNRSQTIDREKYIKRILLADKYLFPLKSRWLYS